jgi:transcriptional regulator with XRE-family HTH domain
MSIYDREPIVPLPEPAERNRLRELFGVTQTEIAEEIGVTRQMVNRYETGRSEPTGHNREVYSRILATWARTEARVRNELKTAGNSIRLMGE